MSAFSLSTLIGISVLCADLRGLIYLFMNFFNTTFIEIKMKMFFFISNGVFNCVSVEST